MAHVALPVGSERSCACPAAADGAGSGLQPARLVRSFAHSIEYTQRLDTHTGISIGAQEATQDKSGGKWFLTFSAAQTTEEQLRAKLGAADAELAQLRVKSCAADSETAQLRVQLRAVETKSSAADIAMAQIWAPVNGLLYGHNTR